MSEKIFKDVLSEILNSAQNEGVQCGISQETLLKICANISINEDRMPTVSVHPDICDECDNKGLQFDDGSFICDSCSMSEPTLFVGKCTSE